MNSLFCIQSVSRILTSEMNDYFKFTFDARNIVWGSWGCSENWLKSKIKPPYLSINKLSLSKSLALL